MIDRQRQSRILKTACLAIVAAIALGNAPADAQSGDSWDCDADNGRFAENPQPLSSGAHVLSGQIRFDAGHLGEWGPVAHIGFAERTADGRNCDCAGLLAMIYSQQPDIVTFFIEANGQKVGIAQAPLGRPITFRLSLDGAGGFTAQVGKTTPQVKSFKLRKPLRNTMHMSCSSAAVSFLGMQLR